MAKVIYGALIGPFTAAGNTAGRTTRSGRSLKNLDIRAFAYFRGHRSLARLRDPVPATFTTHCKHREEMWKRGLRGLKNERIHSKISWALSAVTLSILLFQTTWPSKQYNSRSKVMESSSLRLFRSVEKTRAEKLLAQKGRQQFEYFKKGVEFRHELMLSCLDAFLSHKPHAKWLTLGDVWAREAIYISKNHGRATASSIQDHAIRKAKELGFIDDFSIQNAESITFEDKSFDFVFMKEALHHLARPYAAIYEMTRVAKDAAILFEPTDSRLTAD